MRRAASDHRAAAGEKRQALTLYILLRDARKVTVRGLVGCVESARAPKTEDLQLNKDD